MKSQIYYDKTDAYWKIVYLENKKYNTVCYLFVNSWESALHYLNEAYENNLVIR